MRNRCIWEVPNCLTQSHTVFGPRYLSMYFQITCKLTIFMKMNMFSACRSICASCCRINASGVPNTWAVFQSRNVIPFTPGWLLFSSWILIASNILGSWSTKRIQKEYFGKKRPSKQHFPGGPFLTSSSLRKSLLFHAGTMPQVQALCFVWRSWQRAWFGAQQAASMTLGTTPAASHFLPAKCTSPAAIPRGNGKSPIFTGKFRSGLVNVQTVCYWTWP